MATLTFKGVRGSYQRSEKEYFGFGGNTTCVHINTGLEHIVIDAGSGIRSLGDDLIKEQQYAKTHAQKQKPIHLLFTHYHWDHIEGLRSFAPMFSQDTDLTLYGEKKPYKGTSLEPAGIVDLLFQHPFFPVATKDVAAKYKQQIVAPKDRIELASANIDVLRLLHSQSSVGYIVETAGVKTAMLWDHEFGNPVIDENIERKIAGADILIMDASFTEEEYLHKKGWGHSTNMYAARLAAKSGVKLLVLTHHNGEHTDTVVHKMMQEASYVFPDTFAAAEGMVLDLSCQQTAKKKVV